MTDEHEHAMKVWREAYQAWCDPPPHLAFSQAAAAVIAADRAGLVAENARLREALVSIEEYWNRDQNETAMADACWNAVNTADAALKEPNHD